MHPADSVAQARAAWALPVLRILACLTGAALAAALAVHHVSTPAAAELMDARLPPLSSGQGGSLYILGTDAQGRDILAILAGASCASFLTATLAAALAATIGVAIGLSAAALPRWLDGMLLRLAEVQSSFPAIFVAPILNACLPAAPAPGGMWWAGPSVVAAAIALAAWPDFALSARASARTQWSLDHIEAARAIGQTRARIVRIHIWPAIRPITQALFIWTAARGVGIEAALSYLGAVPASASPSLGRMIRDGQSGLLNGEWWMAAFPIVALVALTALLAIATTRAQPSQDSAL